jgi:hypothetical protein
MEHTIAVPALLAAYNWSPKTERYRKVEHFVQKFFGQLQSLQQPPFHPKWKEVVLSAPLKGWSRFPAAHARSSNSSWARTPGTPSARTHEPPENDEDLYQQFLKWRKSNQTDAKP